MMRVKRIFSGKNVVNQTDSALSSEKKDCICYGQHSNSRVANEFIGVLFEFL